MTELESRRIVSRSANALAGLPGGASMSSSAIAAIAASVFLAILLMPDDPQPEGALFWSALCCSLGLLAIPILRLSRNVLSLLRAEHVLMIGIVYWLLLDPLQGAYPMIGATQSEVATSFIAIGLLAAGIWIGVAGKGWALPNFVRRIVSRPFRSKSLFGALLIAFILGMFHFAFSSGFDPVTMFNGLSACRFCAPWSRGALGGPEAVIEHLKYFGYILPSLTVMIAHQESWLRPRALMGIAMSIIMIAFLSQDGGRRVIGVVVGAALITWLLLQPRIGLKVGGVGLGIVACLLAFMELMLRYRGVGLGEYGERLTPEVESALIRVDDNILRLSQTVKFFPDVHPYVDFGPLIFALIRPIPRFLWPGKPTSPGYDLTELLGEAGFSLTHSIVGELYAMHGLIPVLIGGIFLGCVANMWNKLLTIEGGVGKQITYAMGLMVLFAGLRSMQDFVIMSYGLLAWFVIANFVPKASPLTRSA